MRCAKPAQKVLARAHGLYKLGLATRTPGGVPIRSSARTHAPRPIPEPRPGAGALPLTLGTPRVSLSPGLRSDRHSRIEGYGVSAGRLGRLVAIGLPMDLDGDNRADVQPLPL